MKHLSMLAGSILLTACLFSLSGCGTKRSSVFLPPSNKNGTQGVVLTGYSGIAGTVNQSIPVEPASALTLGNAQNAAQRIVTVDSQYQNQGFLEIKEKMFIAQTNEVYQNPEDYIGKTIKLEGLFQSQSYLDNNSPYYFVIRYGPGCCGSDGNVGFEVMWDAQDKSYPNEDDWVEAVGVLGFYEEDGYPYLCINLSSLQVLENQGAAFVSQ